MGPATSFNSIYLLTNCKVSFFSVAKSNSVVCVNCMFISVHQATCFSLLLWIEQQWTWLCWCLRGVIDFSLGVAQMSWNWVNTVLFLVLRTSRLVSKVTVPVNTPCQDFWSFVFLMKGEMKTSHVFFFFFFVKAKKKFQKFKNGAATAPLPPPIIRWKHNLDPSPSV